MVDLPQPDSPTRAKVVPGAMAKETASTARRNRRFSREKRRCRNGRETSNTCETAIASSIGRSAMGVQPTGRPGRGGGQQLWLFRATAREDMRAAGVEAAAGGNRVEPRHRPVDLAQTIDAMVQRRNAGHQSFGVGMRRGTNLRRHGADLGDAAGV